MVHNLSMAGPVISRPGRTPAPSRPGGAARQARALRAAVRALVRRFSISERADTTCCGLTIAQAATLEALGLQGPLSLGALGRRLGIAPSTLTRNLARLEDRGLVARRRRPGDRRAFDVTLTPAGRGAAAALERREDLFARSVLDRLPVPRRRRALRGLCDLLAAVRGATEACCPGAFDHLMTDFPGDRRR
jgi:DNA-binding MarR family transcriptional regulator